ncbi:MAG: hypothetical protein K0Q59_4669 [Paenibacillus sp.]|jgi:hypothetical protein|nr:hypothetical protein [Paenibacillus sp.]
MRTDRETIGRRALSCGELLEQYRASSVHEEGRKLMFGGVGDRDVYNITAPFADEGELVIAGRVEPRDSQFSKVLFFVQRDGRWVPRPGSRAFELQDPFVSKVGERLVFGGVRVIVSPEQPGKIVSWVTEFYEGASIADLKPLCTGPDHMKDIRLVGLRDGGIGVFTRPQGALGGRGTIGYIRIHSLAELSAETILQAELFKDQFLPEEWGGANEVHLLDSGLIGVLGHIACIDAMKRKHYYPMAFVFDPSNGRRTGIRLIAERRQFPAGPCKREDLADVIFSGGLIRGMDGQATLYAGISDAEAHTLVIPDPFLAYERDEIPQLQ